MKESIKENKEDLGKMRGFSRVTAAIIIIMAIVLILVFLVLFRINFMVGEQLRITLTPEYSEVQTTSPGTVPFEVDVKLYNKFVCDAICTYTLTDLSYDVLLDNGTFNSKAYKSKFYSFNIPLDYYGSGTNAYLYRLECKNIQTTLCPANNDLLVRKSLLTVTYTPSTEQLSARDFTEKNYVVISENIVNASKLIESEIQIIDSTSIAFNSSQYYALKSERDTLLESVDGLISIWRNGDFVSTKSYMVDIHLLNRTANLLSSAVQYDLYLIQTIENHNMLLTELVSIRSSLQEYNKILSLNMFNINASTRNSLTKALRDGNAAINQFESKNYNHGLLYRDVLDISNNIINNNKMVITNTNAELSRDLPAIYIYSNMLCMLQDSNSTTNSSTNSTNSTKTKTTDFCNFNYALNTGTLADASTKLTNICGRVSSILDDMPSTVSGNDSKETLLLQYKLLIDYESIASTAGKHPILTYYSTYLRDSLKDLYNITDPETLLVGYKFNQSKFELTFNRNNLILADIRDIKDLCHDNVSVTALTTLTVKYYNLPTTNSSESVSGSKPALIATPPEIVPQCCMYGKCQSCEKKPVQNPVILLHGHSFNKDVHAYQSIETFNSFEKAFSTDKIYFSIGLLVKNNNSTAGVLGHFYVPLISKPTYYLESYNSLLGLTTSEAKTGNIDTYALRLKESIDYTMYITGSDKVDIVAHSMGGLVVRRYIQVFGTQNLGTVILIGTPNNGVGDKTYTLCKIFGALNECEDMRADGIFIKKLNDYSNQPDIKNLYLVIGKGCDTDGTDGDGVVSVNSSRMNVPENRILYVDGKCSGTTLLHNEMLNIEEYPEVYAFVKEKLAK